MTTYYFVAASEKFLTVEEPIEEILKERIRNYKNKTQFRNGSNRRNVRNC